MKLQLLPMLMANGLRISTIEAGGPYDLTITARKAQITVSNVMLGEVCACFRSVKYGDDAGRNASL